MKHGTASELKLLGTTSDLPKSPSDAVLETFQNPHPDNKYLVRFVCPEFTSLCPKTAQPDFAHIVIDYVPDQRMVESKALKLFMASFRNHGAFHEECTMDIALRLIKAMSPIWLRVSAYWYPRGGIPIDVFYQTNEPPKGMWIPDPGVPSYRGR